MRALDYLKPVLYLLSSTSIPHFMLIKKLKNSYFDLSEKSILTMTGHVCKLLVLDYLKTEISEKFAKQIRQKIDLPEDAKLPEDHPTFVQMFDMVAASTTKNKRKYESSDDDEDDDEEEEMKVPPQKMKKNGSVSSDRSSKDSSYESETENFSGNNSGCFNCKKPGHFSRECPEKSGMKCFNCDQTGHMSRECPDKASSGTSGSVCYNCNQSGHFSRECPEKQNSSGSVCFSCNKTGHFSRECPEKQSRTKCFSCNEFGHMSRECPTGSGGFGGGRKSGGGYGYGGTGSNSVPLGQKKSSA